MPNKTIIIGLDGVPFKMIKEFTDNGTMPNTKALIEKGTFTKTFSTIPEVSSVAWSSIITGKNPAQHGIFGFTGLLPNSYQMTFPNYTNLQEPPFWERWPGKAVIINVPATYPVRDMSGIHISGFVSIDIHRSVYPQQIVSDLETIDYRLDVDSQKAHKSMDSFLDDLDKTLDARIASYDLLWPAIDWQTFMLVFTGTDRLMHFLFEAYEDPNHKYHRVFEHHFKKIDQAIGDIVSKSAPDDTIAILSDHGFEKLDSEVYINYLLTEKGFLTYKLGTEPNLDNICSATKAFAMDPSRIYLNYKGKYPQGSVDPNDAPVILDQLETLFANLTHDGKKVIRDIYRKQDIFKGPLLDDAPDMVLVAGSGFDIKARLRADSVFGKGLFTGKHTQDTAFLILNKQKTFTTQPTVTDLVSILEELNTNS